MKVIYRSDITGVDYGSEEELRKAEADFLRAKKEAEQKVEKERKEREKKNEQRAKKAKEVEAALEEFKNFQQECSKQISEKWDEYLKKRNEFIKEYGEYHYTYRTTTKPLGVTDIFNLFFN